MWGMSTPKRWAKKAHQKVIRGSWEKKVDAGRSRANRMACRAVRIIARFGLVQFLSRNPFGRSFRKCQSKSSSRKEDSNHRHSPCQYGAATTKGTGDLSGAFPCLPPRRLSLAGSMERSQMAWGVRAGLAICNSCPQAHVVDRTGVPDSRRSRHAPRLQLESEIARPLTRTY